MKNRTKRLLKMDVKIRLALLGAYGILTLFVVYLTRGSADASHYAEHGQQQGVSDVRAVLHRATVQLPAEDLFKSQVLKTRVERPVFNTLTERRSIPHTGSDFRILSIPGKDVRMFMRKWMLP